MSAFSLKDFLRTIKRELSLLSAFVTQGGDVLVGENLVFLMDTLLVALATRPRASPGWGGVGRGRAVAPPGEPLSSQPHCHVAG